MSGAGQPNTAEDGAAQVRNALLALRMTGGKTAMRRFALSCATGVIDGHAIPPLWEEAVALLKSRCNEAITEVTFADQAAAIECRFPLLSMLTGLNRQDARATAAFAIMATLHTDATEAALNAAQAERMHAVALSTRLAWRAGLPADDPRRSAEHFNPQRAAFYALDRQMRWLSAVPRK